MHPANHSQVLKHPFYLGWTALLVLILPCCRKFVTVPPPPESPTTAVLFASEASATGVLSGVYSEMIASGALFSGGGTTLYGGLAADELYFYTPGLRDEFTRNELTPAAHSMLSTGFWQPAYRFIYTANLALEKLPSASALSERTRRQLLGEARFVRAFCYLHLTQLFGAVPLVRSTDYRRTMGLARTPPAGVYAAILEDLRAAEEELPPALAPGDRARPTRHAATALRARVHLYRGAWTDAAAAAEAVISSGLFALAPRPEDVFGLRSPEHVFYLEVPPPQLLPPEGALILPLTPAALPTFVVRPELLDAFEAGDGRRKAWTAGRVFAGSELHYPTKYRGPSAGGEKEGYAVLRLAEQYLVRAEARLRLGDAAGARADLNTLRERAGLAPLTVTVPDTLVAAIERERRLELAFEWGHRWADLRRTGRADAVLGALKGASWQGTDTLWPVPQDQIRLNPALTQNPGY